MNPEPRALPPDTAGRDAVGRDVEPWRAEAEALGMPVVEALPAALEREVVALVGAALAREHALVPLRADARGLTLAVAAPAAAMRRLSEIEFVLARRVTLLAAGPAGVHALLSRHYGAPALESPTDDGLEIDASLPAETLAQLPPVARYVEHVLAQAVHEGASDLHFDPGPDALQVRLRVDGALRTLPALPAGAAPAVAARLKVLSGMDLGQRRRAQDGRMSFGVHGRSVDLRIATLPTVHGEGVVIRVLDPRNARFTLEELGLPTACRSALASVCAGSGMVLATGPTGSGKTTTLYALLRAIDLDARKLLTIEDPVEYAIAGGVQVAARPEIGLDFARALRSFLRHDPDVILVGEIRDSETARIAAQAALTGHLLLASLHCGSAVLAPVRLLELGLERWLVSAALELTLAQRLVRCTCRDCGGGGCHGCGGSGFRGRAAIFEWLRMTPALRELIEAGDMETFARRARASMPQRLADAGARLVGQGATTSAELAAQLEIA